MRMGLRFANTFVIALVTFAIVEAQGLAQLDDLTDPDAYAIYAVVVPAAWLTSPESKSPLLLQQETEESSPCRPSLAALDAEWPAVESDFRQMNAHARLLQRLLPVNVPYQLISKSEIAADDARLALKYPGIWQHRPESREYAAVSTVGFNQARTKAMVSVHVRRQGGVYVLEKRDGKWGVVRSGGCHWIH